jgi:hypothetical protein
MNRFRLAAIRREECVRFLFCMGFLIPQPSGYQKGVGHFERETWLKKNTNLHTHRGRCQGKPPGGVHHDTNSPPRSMPRPVAFSGLPPSSGLGGMRLSKLSRRRASRAAIGVLPGPGVLVQAPAIWAGLGVMLRNSEKLRLAPGVLRPKPAKGAPPPPGVDIMDEGKGVDFGGGVEGATIRGVLELAWAAGEGEVARYMRRLASSSSPARVREAAPVKGS